MEPTTTADGLCSYDRIYRSRQLRQWIEDVHRANCLANGWRVTPLKVGAFGYDNLALSLHHLFNLLEKDPEASEEQRAAAIHDGWAQNYVYWRDNKPWLNSARGTYHKPASALGDTRRNMCASTSYDELPQDEKDKDLIIDKIVNELDGYVAI